MQYYCFELDNASKELCTIAMPFGLYRYRHLPMGVNQSPDIAQQIMERVLPSIMEEIECYIDDITAFSDDWESHKTLLNKLLTKLQNTGFTVNPLKCEWAVQETDFLGHCLTLTRIKLLSSLRDCEGACCEIMSNE
jgi:Reverse transcriptase (RNA-dependent DNA polymerase)